MKKIVLNAGLFFITSYAFAQAPHYAWAKQTSGITNTSAAGIGCVAVDTVNQYVYTLGSFAGGSINFGTGELPGSAGSNSVFLAKYNLGGGLTWAKSFPSPHNNNATGIAVDRSGNLFITGYSQDDTIRFGGQFLLNSHPASTDHTVGYIAKLDASGNTLWLKGSTGGGGVVVNAVAVDAAGDAVMTGHVFDNTGTFMGNTTTEGAFVMKVSGSSGNSVWFSQVLPSGPLVSEGTSVAIDHSGNVVIAGAYAQDLTFGSIAVSYASGNGTTDRFTAKLDGSNGSFTWAVGSGIEEGADRNMDLSLDAQDNVYLTGFMCVLDQSSNATQLQFIEKLNANGVSQWINNYPNNVPVGPTSIVSDHSGNSYVTYNIYDTTAYGAYTVYTHTPYTFLSIVTAVVKVDPNGNVLFAKGTNDPSTGSWASCISIAMDTYGYLYTTGTLSYKCDFDGTMLDAGNSGTEVTLAKLGGSATAGVHELSPSLAVDVFPNPASNALTVSRLTGKARFSISDMQGRMILSGSVSDADRHIDISAVPDGIYMLEVTMNNASYHQKLIVKK